MKKVLSLILALALVLTAVVMIPVSSGAEALPMYVYTKNGKGLNVRSSPEIADNVIGSLAYGAKVDVEFINASGWAVILYGGGEAYVQGRFLQDSAPGPAPTPSKEEENATEAKKLSNELKSEKVVSEPFYVIVVATRTSGWINFRSGPSKTTSRVASFPEGKELVVQGETKKWYRAFDPETGKVGYIFKQYTQKIAKPYTVETAASGGVEKLGSLNVNGKFDLTCKIAEGYDLQVLQSRGDRIIASVTPLDMTRPELYLSIAYDESYAHVERINDMTDEELAILENTFKDMNDVDITYRETGYGTKLLVARETGTDTDFVDILAIYKGYFIEFNMTPNPRAADQTLSNEQIRMCIDFLTDVNFIPTDA